jgi:hypothetical protein
LVDSPHLLVEADQPLAAWHSEEVVQRLVQAAQVFEEAVQSTAEITWASLVAALSWVEVAQHLVEADQPLAEAAQDLVKVVCQASIGTCNRMGMS